MLFTLLFGAGFQSTPPVKAATIVAVPVADGSAISIHAAREGGDPRVLTYNSRFQISIHAAREGGDEALQNFIAMRENFNPRRP